MGLGQYPLAGVDGVFGLTSCLPITIYAVALTYTDGTGDTLLASFQIPLNGWNPITDAQAVTLAEEQWRADYSTTYNQTQYGSVTKWSVAQVIQSKVHVFEVQGPGGNPPYSG